MFDVKTKRRKINSYFSSMGFMLKSNDYFNEACSSPF